MRWDEFIDYDGGNLTGIEIAHPYSYEIVQVTLPPRAHRCRAHNFNLISQPDFMIQFLSEHVLTIHNSRSKRRCSICQNRSNDQNHQHSRRPSRWYFGVFHRQSKGVHVNGTHVLIFSELLLKSATPTIVALFSPCSKIHREEFMIQWLLRVISIDTSPSKLKSIVIIVWIIRFLKCNHWD